MISTMRNSSKKPTHDELPECVVGVPFLAHRARSMHLEMDYNHGLPEVAVWQQENYYASPPGISVMNMDFAALGRYQVMWRQCNGGKTGDHTVSSLNYMLEKCSTGAGVLTISLDSAGHNMCHQLIQYLHYISSPYCPERKFLRIRLFPFTRGHSQNTADAISSATDQVYKKSGVLLCLCDRLNCLNDSLTCDVNGLEMDEFLNIEQEFKSSGVYLKPADWYDIPDNSIPMLFYLRLDKPAVIDFQVSDVYDENSNTWKQCPHLDEIWVQMKCGKLEPFRKIPIISHVFRDGVKLPKLLKEKKPKPDISTVNAGNFHAQRILKLFFRHKPNFNQLLDLYPNTGKPGSTETIPNDPTEDPAKYVQMVEYRLNVPLRTAGKRAKPIKPASVRKQGRKVKNRSCDGSVATKYTIEGLVDAKQVDLRGECAAHGQPTYGANGALKARLALHYSQIHGLEPGIYFDFQSLLGRSQNNTPQKRKRKSPNKNRKRRAGKELCNGDQQAIFSADELVSPKPPKRAFLQKECSCHGLAIYGSKSELVDRLVKHYRKYHSDIVNLE